MHAIVVKPLELLNIKKQERVVVLKTYEGPSTKYIIHILNHHQSTIIPLTRCL